VSEIKNIHHLETYPHEKIDFPKGIIYDVPRMLAHVAIQIEPQRRSLNAHKTWLGHEGGIGNAESLIKNALPNPVSPVTGEDEEITNEGLWIFSRRLDTWNLAGSIMVKKGVSIVNDRGEIVIDNGILVEAVTAPGQEHELAEFYKKGIIFANKKASNEETVFSIEPDEPEFEKQSRLKRWISGGLEYKPEIPMSIFRNYTFKEKLNATRSDFKRKKAVPAIIYTNQPL
jgi:hypothetical protein